MVWKAGYAAFASLILAANGPAQAAEPIEGRWRVPNGEIAAIASCGADYCALAATGPYRGKRIGRFARAGEGYAGTVTDPSTDRTYAGTATVDGERLKLTGCALKVLCRSQTWTRP